MNIWADNHLDNCVFFHGEGFGKPIDSNSYPNKYGFNMTHLSKVD